MFDDNVMELLLVIAQHAHAVSITSFINPDAHPAFKVTKSCASIGVHTVTYGHGVTCWHAWHSRDNQSVLQMYLGTTVMAFGYLSGHSLLQKPFRTEAPLLMEIFQQVFNGATAAELAQAIAPPVAQRQPGQSRRANIVRPKGDAQVT